MRIIFGTGNKNKLREIREIMAGLDYEIVTAADAGIDSDPEENGESFEENALIKARAVSLMRSQEPMGSATILYFSCLNLE